MSNTVKLRWASWKQKDWYRNMDNIVINYKHMGECGLYLVHMDNKCRIDRLGGVSKVYRFK